ncbi:hypothetical protein Tco_0155787 [Tanacetum coccineum]
MVNNTTMSFFKPGRTIEDVALYVEWMTSRSIYSYSSGSVKPSTFYSPRELLQVQSISSRNVQTRSKLFYRDLSSSATESWERRGAQNRGRLGLEYSLDHLLLHLVKWAAFGRLMIECGTPCSQYGWKLLGPRRMTKKINVHPEWKILQTLTNGAKRKLDHLLLHLVNGLLWKTNDESGTLSSRLRWKLLGLRKDLAIFDLDDNGTHRLKLGKARK